MQCPFAGQGPTSGVGKSMWVVPEALQSSALHLQEGSVPRAESEPLGGGCGFGSVD